MSILYAHIANRPVANAPNSAFKSERFPHMDFKNAYATAHDKDGSIIAGNLQKVPEAKRVYATACGRLVFTFKDDLEETPTVLLDGKITNLYGLRMKKKEVYQRYARR